MRWTKLSDKNNLTTVYSFYKFLCEKLREPKSRYRQRKDRQKLENPKLGIFRRVFFFIRSPGMEGSVMRSKTKLFESLVGSNSFHRFVYKKLTSDDKDQDVSGRARGVVWVSKQTCFCPHCLKHEFDKCENVDFTGPTSRKVLKHVAGQDQKSWDRKHDGLELASKVKVGDGGGKRPMCIAWCDKESCRGYSVGRVTGESEHSRPGVAGMSVVAEKFLPVDKTGCDRLWIWPAEQEQERRQEVTIPAYDLIGLFQARQKASRAAKEHAELGTIYEISDTNKIIRCLDSFQIFPGEEIEVILHVDEGAAGGIGAEVSKDTGGTGWGRIVKVARGQAASRVKLMAGDELLVVNGKKVAIGSSDSVEVYASRVKETFEPAAGKVTIKLFRPKFPLRPRPGESAYKV